MNHTLAQLRLEREARARGESPQREPEPELEPERALVIHNEAPARREEEPSPPRHQPEPEPEPEQRPVGVAKVQREQRLQHLRSRRRSRPRVVADPGAPTGPSLGGLFGLDVDARAGQQAAAAGAGPRRPAASAEDLGFEPTLEATLGPTPVRPERQPTELELYREQRRSVGRALLTAAELGFSGDLAAVLGSARPRRRFTPEPEPDQPGDGREDGGGRPSRYASAAELGFAGESLEAAFQPAAVRESSAEPTAGLVDWDAGAEAALVSDEDVYETVEGLGLGEMRRSAEEASAGAVGGEEVWTPRTAELLEPEAGGFYSGGGATDQDRTPFPMRGGGELSARSARASPVPEPEPAAAIQQTVDPFLAAIEAATPSTPEWPAFTQQQLQAQRGAPSRADQDSTPFPATGRPRQNIGDGVPGAPPVATPSDHALGMEALARNAQGMSSATVHACCPLACSPAARLLNGRVRLCAGSGLPARSSSSSSDRSGLARYGPDGAGGGRGQRGGAAPLSPHPEWVLPPRRPVARAEPGRRRSTRRAERARAEGVSEAAGVALASLLEQSGEWTYEQLIALDETNAPRAGLSYMTVRDFERKQPSAEEVAAGGECAVCLEVYTERDWLKRLPCEHCYHEDCILHWFKDHHACPMCRFDCR